MPRPSRQRRAFAILVLVLALPAYIVAAVSLVALFERPSFWVELAVYLGLGVLWILPLRGLFRGIAQAPQPADDERDQGPKN